jgi:hypothetical protein
MKITEESFAAFLTQFDQLITLANIFHTEKVGRGDKVQVEPDGQVSYEVNTACNCHPEYEREYLSREDFLRFIEDYQNR